MTKGNESTEEKILAAATSLIADQGFQGTTTKDIAREAGVSEMSVFRHFGSKKAILQAIMRRYSFEYPIENGLREQLTWELEHDLLLLAQMQYTFNLQNEKAILIRFKESKKILLVGLPSAFESINYNVAQLIVTSMIFRFLSDTDFITKTYLLILLPIV